MAFFNDTFVFTFRITIFSTMAHYYNIILYNILYVRGKIKFIYIIYMSTKTYTIDEYFDLFDKFVDCVGYDNNIQFISFEELYRANYNMTLQKNYDIINLAFEAIRNEIAKLEYDVQQAYLNVVNNIFMYPIRMNVMNSCMCSLCGIDIQYNNLYCDMHIKHKKCLNDIKKFKLFKTEGIIGGKVYEELLI
jgi:hypothetical protein